MDQIEMVGRTRPLSERATPFLYVGQLVLAIVVLGLDAYGIQHIKYNVLIYSMVVALCTIFVNIYCFLSRNVSQQQLAIQSSAPFHKPEQSIKEEDDAHKINYKTYVTLGLYIWMFVFWIVDLGLVASLAVIWGEPGCTYNFWDGYRCAPYGKRGIYGRSTVSYGTYYGALVAGACLAAVQVVLSVGTIAILLGVIARTHRLNKTRKPLPNSPQTVSETQEVDDHWGSTIPAVRTGPQPLLDSPEPGYESHTLFTNLHLPHPQYAMPSPSGYA